MERTMRDINMKLWPRASFIANSDRLCDICKELIPQGVLHIIYGFRYKYEICTECSVKLENCPECGKKSEEGVCMNEACKIGASNLATEIDADELDPRMRS